MEDPNDGKIVRTRSKSKSKDSPRKEKKNKKKSKDSQDVNMRSSPDKKDKTPRRTQSDAVPSKTKVEKVDSSCSSGDMQISVQKNPIHPSRSDPCVYPENDPSEEVRSPSRRKRSLSYINNNNGAGNANSSQGNLPKPVKSSKMEIRLSSNSDHGLLPPIPLEDDPPLPPIPKENSWNLPSFVQNFIPRDSKSEISGSEDDDLNSVASDPAQLPPQETDHNRKRANTIATTYGVPFDYSDLEQREGSRNLDDSFASFDQRSFNDDSESNSERKKIGSRRSSARNSGNFNRLNDVKLWLSPRAFGRPRGLSAPPAIVKKKRRGSVVLSPQLIGSNTTDTRRVVEGKLEETDEDRRNTNPSEENFKFETSRPSSASSGRRTNLTVSRHRDSNADSPSMIPKSNTSSDLAYTAKFFEEETDSKAIVRVRSSTTANIKETIKINIHTLNKNKKNRTLKKIQDRSAAHLSGGTFPSLERGLSGMDLETCIKNEKASILFWVFLRSCYHQETYSFWLATEEYRNITDPVLRKRRAVEMHEKYFKSGSEYELSVDDEIKVMIDRETGKIDPSPEIFDEVQFEVWQNLAYLFYPKFQQSSYYRELFSSESNIANGQLSELKRSDTYRRLRLFQSKMGRNRSFSIAVSEPTEYGVAFGVKRGKCASCPCERYRASNKDDVCSCGHWPIKHANMGKASVPLSDIIGEKDKVLIKLMEPGLKLISALCDHCDAENIENVSRSIFYLFDYHERTEELLKFAVAREIRTTRDSKQLFREDKMTFRIISTYMNHKSKDWLKSVLGPSIKELNSSSGSYEINPDRLDKPKNRKENLKRLRKAVLHFCKTIFASSDAASSYVRLLCSLVRKEVRTAFPEAEATGLGALVFLRLICPALCSPQRFGLIDENLNPNPTRGLILVAKILQNVSTNMKFGEDFMKDLDDIVETCYPQMKKFLFSLSEKKQVPDQDRKILKSQRDESLDILHGFVSKSSKLLQLNL